MIQPHDLVANLSNNATTFAFPMEQLIKVAAMNDRESVFRALDAGADGYLLKRTKPADLRISLLEVINGGGPMSSQITRHVIESFRC